MDYQFQGGIPNRTIYLFLTEPSTAAPKTGLLYSGIIASYVRPLAARLPITPLITQTVTGVHSDGGFVEVDATNMPGLYRFDLPDNVTAVAAHSVHVTITDIATNELYGGVSIQLVGYDPQGGLIDANVLSFNGNNIDDYSATLKLHTIEIINNGGNALYLESSGSGGSGIYCRGNGSGPGIVTHGGETGAGVEFHGGNMSGAGMLLNTHAGPALSLTPVGGDGIAIANATDSGRGIRITNTHSTGACLEMNSTGAGPVATLTGAKGISIITTGINGYGIGISTSGATAHGISVIAAGAGARGIDLIIDDGDGIRLSATGTNRTGFRTTGGAGGHGILASGATTGSGIQANGGTSAGAGIKATGGTGGIGLACVAGSGGLDFSGNITGNLSGSIGSLGPTGTAAVAAALLVTPAQKIVTDPSGRVFADTRALAGNVTAATAMELYYKGAFRGGSVTGGTSTSVQTDMVQASGFWDNAVLVFNSGGLQGVARHILSYISSNGTFSVAALPAPPSPGDTFLILGRIDP